MLRATVFAFIAGWIAWFWLDKNPATLGPLPQPVDGDYLRNFQVSINLLKQGRFQAAFIYVWKAHYIVLSIAAGLALAMLFAPVSRSLARRKWLKLYLPGRKNTEKTARKQHDQNS